MSEPVENGGAGWVLVGVGAVQLIWALIYLVMSVLGFAMGGCGALMGIAAVLDSGDPTLMCMGIYGAVIPLINMLAYLIFSIMAVVIIVGGIRFNQFRSFGMVRMASFFATGIPLLALLLSLTAICGALTNPLGLCTGLICSNIPSFIMLLLGGGATFYAMSVMGRDEVAAQFAMNDAQ